MRKLFLLSMLFVATTGFSQVVLWNGDDKEAGSDSGFWGRAEPTVVDEGGNKVMKFTLKANPGGWDQEHHNAALPVGDADFKGLRRVTFRLKMADKHNVMVQLEGKNGAYNAKRIFWYDTPGEWQVMVYEYSVGPENDKITDTGSNVLAIWPYEETADGEGKTFYVDDIKVEGPMVNGVAVRSLADNSLTSRQVEITGSLSKGQYQNTWNGDWHMENYDDYATVTSKISADVCFLNLTGAAVSDGDSPQLRTKNPNLLILSPKDFYNTDNVIRWDDEKKTNTTPKMVLTDSHDFYTPIDFHADAVEVTRNLKAGINTLCLPFYVGEAEISNSCKIATYLSSTASVVNFAYADHADANVPFLATAVDADAETLSFTDKGVVTTPVALGTTFVGIYAQQSAENHYGINAEGKFQKGGSTAIVKSFRAVLTSVPAAAPAISLIDGDATGINMVRGEGLSVDGAEACYNLQGQRVTKPAKGLYIVNGKKVMFK